jgi:hypothetical protein
MERKRKVAVIGGGTSGLLSASMLSMSSPIDVDVYYDPAIKPLSVGEGANYALVDLLKTRAFFSSSDIKNVLHGTKKMGIRKVNWAGNGDFLHEFLLGNYSVHFDSALLREYLKETMNHKVNLIEKNIVDKSNIDADFVYDCSGFPTEFSEDEFDILESIPVNASYVVQCDWDGPRFDYTLCEAMPEGWVFMIPLQNRCSVGYIHNSNISSKEKIKEGIKEILSKYNLKSNKEGNFLDFNNYRRKKNFLWNHGWGGNASFFMEPLEATTLGNVITIAREVVHIVADPGYVDPMNHKFKKIMDGTEDMIAFHYFMGSKYNTDFWKMAKEKATKRLVDSIDKAGVLKMIQTISKKQITSVKPPKDAHFEYGTWPIESWAQNIEGFNALESLKKLIS